MTINCDGHCFKDGLYHVSADDTVRSLDLYGIDKICCSSLISYVEALGQCRPSKRDREAIEWQNIVK